MRILFTRHGESQANVLRAISNRGLKHPLTLKGREQAALLAERLEHEPVARIYCSPVLRAIETAALIAHRLGVEYEVTEALREFDAGILEGRSDEEAWQVWRGLFDDWTKHGRKERAIEGGESFFQMEARFGRFVEGLVREYGRSSDPESSVLCVAHGGLYWMMLPVVLRGFDGETIGRQHGFDYTGLITAELRPEGLVCVAWDGGGSAAGQRTAAEGALEDAVEG